MRATPGRLPTNGDPVSVMLRPERLHVAVDGPADGRSIEGVDHATLIFQGAVAAAASSSSRDGTEIVTTSTPTTTCRSCDRAHPSRSTWSPGAAYLLPAGRAQPGATTTDVDQIEATL